ncbi:hypothetical protein OGAPHI_000897 [Ogataea philodendri]|uniref:2,2-dialkylglycine decarboxylase n=1 Tax=Ogataea philodendri TaxID=1378263 RepID=A0A9P8PE84_9ASCO|nr:uncharacterized protein OGAPHI_000897 [Ogataea philodendri]KAH3670382.1 hypothetical protein OGAPHI_000897 [Ogataea philodendri]
MTVSCELTSSDFWQKADSTLLNFGGTFVREIIVGSKGLYVYTNEGKKILDFTSGQMSCLIGHCNEEIGEVISNYAYNLDHIFSGMLCPPVVDLASKLSALTPEGLDRSVFLSTGAESNECAIKLAKTYTGKFEIVGLSLSWHGMTGNANSCTYQSGRSGHGPTVPGQLVLPAPNEYRSIFRHPDGSYDWKTELLYGWSLVDASSVGSLAAVILEPVLSSGGMLVLPDGYLKEMKHQCELRGMLLIVDEAQTGIGRAGSMFASIASGVVPDILTLSKTLGNGLPLSAVMTSNKIAEVTQEKGFLFYTTHVNDPIPAAVGSKVLDIVIRDNLVENSIQRGVQFREGLEALAETYPWIGNVRGKGLMCGMELVKDKKTKEPYPELASKLAAKMMSLGLSANLIAVKSFGTTFRMAPPISITQEEMSEGLRLIEEAFKSVVAEGI